MFFRFWDVMEYNRIGYQTVWSTIQETPGSLLRLQNTKSQSDYRSGDHPFRWRKTGKRKGIKKRSNQRLVANSTRLPSFHTYDCYPGGYTPNAVRYFSFLLIISTAFTSISSLCEGIFKSFMKHPRHSRLKVVEIMTSRRNTILDTSRPL